MKTSLLTIAMAVGTMFAAQQPAAPAKSTDAKPAATTAKTTAKTTKKHHKKAAKAGATRTAVTPATPAASATPVKK